MCVCTCNCHCVFFFFLPCLFFKSTTSRRHLNLPTWQLAPLITKSNTHQWMFNEAFLRELWLTMGLGSTPRVWITYYVLLKHSVKYTDEWICLRHRWKSCHKPDRVLISDKQLEGDNSRLQSVPHHRSPPQNLPLQSWGAETAFRVIY